MPLTAQDKPMHKPLHNKVALVTGGSSGLGLAAASRLAADGAMVFITGRRTAELEAAAAQIDGEVVAVQADISKSKDLDRLYDVVRSAKGRLDILYANAGVQAKEALGSITEEALDYQLAVNFKGTIYTVQKALPLMGPGASIILTSSATAAKGLPQRTVYSATKAAIRSFARSWTTELKGRGIRVNVVSPGPVLTPGVETGFANEEQRRGYEAMLSHAVPMGRAGRAEEIADAVAFLASDASSFISGADIQVDGGFAQI